jgi:hypothetical protein
MRQKVFGDGLALGSGSGSAIRKVPEGVHGAHGRFNRVQRTLDGRERVVDSLGRTEEEVEEEEALLVASLQGLIAHKKRQQEQEVPEAEGLGMGTFFRKKRLDVDLVKREDMIAGTLGAAQLAEMDEGLARDVAAATAAAGGADEEQEEPVEHSSIRPMWLLRFFMGWGARWSARAATIPPTGSADIKSPPETAPTSPFSLATPLGDKEERVFVDSPNTATPSILVSLAESEQSRKDR